MSRLQRWQNGIAGLTAALVLAACGGGGGGASPPPAALVPGSPASSVPSDPAAPAITNNTATDGFNWINYRRSQIGMPLLVRNPLIDSAAQLHSDYLRLNNTVSHDQIAGKPGYTGVGLEARLAQAGYSFNRSANFAFGEVISATTSNSGVYMAEELITAIYHRFVIFEPRFKEMGTGAATNASGYTYFTADFAANNGYSAGVGKGNLATWPANGQTGVTRNFFSDYEAPDPVAELNEVGYPVSVHADIDAVLAVTSFTMRPRGESDIPVKLLRRSTDEHTPRSAAALVPLALLRAGTTYEVTFTGTSDGAPVAKSWSFTTR